MPIPPLRHPAIRMGGRDPDEEHRVSTPLELFFDLTFAIAFGVASAELAGTLAAGHVGAGLLGFAFAMFAVIWAWINFSWFASAYDTDDWIFRLVTMVQMVGVLLLAMGIQPLFTSLVQGNHVDNGVMVMGYVVMRLALVFQWLRAARQDPDRRAVCLRYAKYLAIAQAGWVAIIFIPADVPLMFAMITPLFVLEMVTPLIAERGLATPWHAHHIAERYSLLTIIALGECLVGTIDTLRVVVAGSPWTVDAAVLGLAGTGLAFAMWWLYFIFPAGPSLHLRRNRAFVFGYSHILIFSAIAATGAGLHVFAYYLAGQAQIGEVAVVATVAVPVAVFALTLTVVYAYMVGPDPLHAWLLAAACLMTGGAVALAATGVDVTVCLLLILFAPSVSIVADELVGHRRRAAALARLEAHYGEPGRRARTPEQ